MVRNLLPAVPGIFLSFFLINAAELIEGNASPETQTTFTFPIGSTATIYTQSDLHWYLAASPAVVPADGAKNFSLSIANSLLSDHHIQPLAPELVTLNGIANQQNPIFGQGIAFLDVAEGLVGPGLREHPVLVLNNDPQRLYILSDIRGGSEVAEPTISVLSSGILPDATGAQNSGIVGLAVGGGAAQRVSPYIVSAVAAAGSAGVFGAVGSGIALALFELINVVPTLKTIDAPTGTPSFPIGNRALPFDVTSSVVAITDPVSLLKIQSIIWDPQLARFFIACTVQGGVGASDGARAVVGMRFLPTGGLQLYPVAPDSAFATGADFIVGQTGSSVQLSIQKVAIMHTSTGLPYMIVQGGVGAPGTTSTVVSALPLIGAVQSAELRDTIGTLASKAAEPIDVFKSNGIFSGRIFTVQATTPADMPQPGEPPVAVGAGPLPYGDITDMSVQADAVFVTVALPFGNNKPGIFSSQALFSSTGKIIGWTAWQRIVSTTDAVENTAFDVFHGSFLWLARDAMGNPNTIKRSLWGLGDAQNFLGAQPNIMANFNVPQDSLSESGGVYSATDFCFGLAGLNSAAFFGLGGQNSFMLMQTGVLNGSAPIPLGGSDFAVQAVFPDSTINQTLPIDNVHSLFFTGGVLELAGPILTSAIGASGDNGWLFVGGTGGVAVLSQDNGAGWDTTIGLGDLFVGLVPGMSFKKFGNYTNVRRLVVDGEFLYVVSYDKVDRISLSDPELGLGTPVAVTIASGAMPVFGTDTPIIFDFIPSAPIGLLGTSNGLLRNGDGTNIQTVASTETGNWTRIELPESVGPVYRFSPLSITGSLTDYAQGVGGNVYLLNVARSQDRGRLYRLAIANTGAVVTGDTVQLFNDYFIEDRVSYFANLGQFKSYFFTDGALFFNSHDYDYFFPETPSSFGFSLRVLGTYRGPYPSVGVRFLEILGQNIAIFGDRNLLNIVPVRLTGLLRPCPSGAYFTCGNYGVRVNE